MDISNFKEQDKSYEELLPQVKFFTRYLKERGLFAAYKNYVRNPKTYNQFQKNYPNWSFKEAVSNFGVKNLVSRLVSWGMTKEGANYWRNVSENFKKAYELQFPEG